MAEAEYYPAESQHPHQLISLIEMGALQLKLIKSGIQLSVRKYYIEIYLCKNAIIASWLMKLGFHAYYGNFLIC